MNSELNKKELKQEYKDAPSTAGIYLIKNSANGSMLIASAQNAQGVLNRHQFELKFGQHRNRKLQEEWKQYGEAIFEFTVIEHVKPDEQNIKTALEQLLEKHINQLGINSENSY